MGDSNMIGGVTFDHIDAQKSKCSVCHKIIYKILEKAHANSHSHMLSNLPKSAPSPPAPIPSEAKAAVETPSNTIIKPIEVPESKSKPTLPEKEIKPAPRVACVKKTSIRIEDLDENRESLAKDHALHNTNGGDSEEKRSESEKKKKNGNGAVVLPQKRGPEGSEIDVAADNCGLKKRAEDTKPEQVLEVNSKSLNKEVVGFSKLKALEALESAVKKADDIIFDKALEKSCSNINVNSDDMEELIANRAVLQNNGIAEVAAKTFNEKPNNSATGLSLVDRSSDLQSKQNCYTINFKTPKIQRQAKKNNSDLSFYIQKSWECQQYLNKLFKIFDRCVYIQLLKDIKTWRKFARITMFNSV